MESKVIYDSFIEPEYNPKIHLHHEIFEKRVDHVYLLDGYKVVKKCPTSKSGEASKMAYTAPFQVLSDEGIYVLRKIIEKNKKYGKSFGVGNRTPLSLRGLAFHSKFIKDFNECPVLLKYLSDAAGKELVAHSYTSSYSHTNIGVVGDNRAVDQWHADSVPFVLVILMSDMSGSEGGELQVVKTDREKAFELISTTNNNVPKDLLLNANYPGLGWGLFMQGSLLVHHVTPVKNGKEARITVVNSYMPRDPFAPDETMLAVFKNEPETCYYEYARHRSWRAREQLNSLLNNTGYIDAPPEVLAATIRKIVEELGNGADIIDGKKVDGHVQKDGLPYFMENKSKM